MARIWRGVCDNHGPDLPKRHGHPGSLSAFPFITGTSRRGEGSVSGSARFNHGKFPANAGRWLVLWSRSRDSPESSALAPRGNRLNSLHQRRKYSHRSQQAGVSVFRITVLRQRVSTLSAATGYLRDLAMLHRLNSIARCVSGLPIRPRGCCAPPPSVALLTGMAPRPAPRPSGDPHAPSRDSGSGMQAPPSRQPS